MSFYKKIIYCIVFIVIFPAALFAGQIKLATWNMEWLNENNGAGNTPRSDIDYNKIKDYARKLDADIIAIEEVQNIAAANRIFPRDLYDVILTDHGKDIRVGFAIKKGINWKSNGQYSDLNIEGTREGMDISVSISDDVAIRILAVHLKSGCFDKPLNSVDTSCRILNRQIPVLEKWIDDRASEEQPFIVLGDFNRRLKEKEEVWLDIDDGIPLHATLKNYTAGRFSNCWNGLYPEYIDHIVANDLAAKYIDPSSFNQLVYSAEDSQYKISDHCPISIIISDGIINNQSQ